MTSIGPFADPTEVAAWIDAGRPVVLADLSVGADAERLRPGAVAVDLDTVCADPPEPVLGRHPLPSPERFAAELGALGIGPDSIVIAYDDLRGLKAGRLVWMLRVLGRDAALLDGGAAAAAAAGLATDPPTPTTCPVVPWPADELVDADAVVAHVAAGGRLLDARAPERYRGETEPLDAVAGHIPGAENQPFTDTMDTDGRLLDDAALGARLGAFGADTVASCGSGVSACQLILAVERATGGRPRLYVGSWSGWSTEPGRPIATGPDPTP